LNPGFLPKATSDETSGGTIPSFDPALRPAYEAATTDAGRLRVVVDQVATLTDTSAVAWHARLCR